MIHCIYSEVEQISGRLAEVKRSCHDFGEAPVEEAAPRWFRVSGADAWLLWEKRNGTPWDPEIQCNPLKSIEIHLNPLKSFEIHCCFFFGLIYCFFVF